MNIQRFRQVLAYIEKHTNKWNQKRCTDCLIAHACRMHGNEQWAFHFKNFNPLDLSDDEWLWVIDGNRTLDDFRTIARRPFA